MYTFSGYSREGRKRLRPQTTHSSFLLAREAAV